MGDLFPDLLRAVITDIMLILLLCTMATPKYENKFVYIITTAIILIGNISTNYYFYRTENYTAVFYVDFVMLIVIGVVLKPLFIDKIMQWWFSYITMVNIYAAVVFLSYLFCDMFPKPIYANAYLRLILFSTIIIVFRRWVSKLYRNVLDYWHIYMLPIVTLLVCFLGYFFGGDIEERLIYNYLPIMLLIFLGLSIYIAIIHSLKRITQQYIMREENNTMQSEREYLYLAAEGMSQKLKLMDEVAQQNSRAAHDRRHFNNMILELLEQGDNSEAIAILKSQNQGVQKVSRVYCENPVVNASICHYAALAEELEIKTHIELDIPHNIAVDSLELSMVISNLLENAIHACQRLSSCKEKQIHFVCCNVGRLLLEMENTCMEDTTLGEDGYPMTDEAGHGIGTKSVITFVKKYDGELIYNVEKGIFQVRLLV